MPGTELPPAGEDDQSGFCLRGVHTQAATGTDNWVPLNAMQSQSVLCTRGPGGRKQALKSSPTSALLTKPGALAQETTDTPSNRPQGSPGPARNPSPHEAFQSALQNPQCRAGKHL